MNDIRNHVKVFLSKPANIILIIFATALCLLTLYPLTELVRHTFVVHATDMAVFPGLTKGTLTLKSWGKLLFTEANKYSLINFYEPMLNSILLSALSAIFALIFGGTVAWLITRTNLKSFQEHLYSLTYCRRGHLLFFG